MYDDAGQMDVMAQDGDLSPPFAALSAKFGVLLDPLNRRFLTPWREHALSGNP